MMKTLLAALAALTATAVLAQEVTVIKAGALIDGKSNDVRRNVTIVVRGNRIESVGGAAPANARVIDLSNMTVLPGLIDAHTHLFLQGEDNPDYDTQLLKFPASYRAARAAVSARRALEQGFTTIRDVETEGAGYGDIGIKMAVNDGSIPGPRIFASTRGISTTGGYNLEGYAPEIEVPKGVQIVDGPVEARKAAREQLDHGADWIKVYMTHRSWLDRDGNLVSQPTLTVEELRAIVDEAHGWKRKVACHAYNGEGLHRALDGGCDSIEHGLELVPTLSVYYDHNAPPDTPAGRRDAKRVSLHGVSFAKALKAGVKIAFGTDVGGFSWKDPIAQEFGRMVSFGMPPMDAIRAATSRAAELLDQPQLGSIAPGNYADIVAVPGDPLQNIELMKDVRFVMKDGVVFK
jgi:imidazolonepropionase-like amidohydrolase